MSHPHQEEQHALSFEQLRKQAMDLLRAGRSGDPVAVSRMAIVPPFRLADAQFAIAREAGFSTWAQLKRHLVTAGSRLEAYESLARGIADLFAKPERESEIVEQLRRFTGRKPDAAQLREHVLRRLGGTVDEKQFTLADAQRFVASLYALDSWRDLEAGSRRPFVRVQPGTNAIEPVPPVVLADDWDEILDIMRAQGLTELRSAGQVNDQVLRKLSRHCGEFLTSLHLEGSVNVTDAGLRHLADLPRLEKVNLTGCAVTDRGMAVFQKVPMLREFYLYHHHGGVTDKGLSHLSHCSKLERVDLLGSNCGDGVLRALASAPNLRHFKSGNHLTDDGLKLLHQFPRFKQWQGERPEYTLIGFDTARQFLLLRGALTGRGIANLAGLDGLFALNLDDGRLQFSAGDLEPLKSLPHLGWLGLDANDATMAVAGQLPHLRMLMCQDTIAGDAGFRALSESQTLEYIWGRRCYNLTGPGFTALSGIPTLKGLSVSCRNVPDAALEALPHFPSLTGFMPMDVPDAGFRHVGKMESLEELWCMYCRDTTDLSTEHLRGLTRLRSYYAGANQITDRSLEILSGIASLEKLEFHACAGITNAGVGKLGALPRLRELTLGYMPAITRSVLAAIPSRIRVTLEG